VPTPASLPDQQELQDALREAFTPTRPQRSRKRLAGRTPELRRIFHAITQERAHVDRLGAATAVVEAVKDEPGYRHYFAVVAAVDSAMTETPLAGEALWKLGVGVFLDMMAGGAPE
jgi:hypothetical protein